MPDWLLLMAALLFSVCGMAWLALAMKVHWQQVFRDQSEPSATTARMLRAMGAASIVASLWLCLASDHLSMAVLVWVMSLAASALAVAFILSGRPGLLSVLLPRTRGTAGSDKVRRQSA